MIDEDLRQRARRLASGVHRPDDVDRLYLGQRDRSWGRSAFREIGDFVAHRDTRDKGLLTQTARDVFTSFDVWSLDIRGLKPTREDVIRAAHANLRLASDAQLKAGCGCGRSAARKRLAAAIQKTGDGALIGAAEERVLQYLGNRFIWKPAFTGDQLFTEFADVLVRNNILAKADVPGLKGAKTYLILHALAAMHGSAVTTEGGARAKLFAGYANKDRWLEVKVELSVPDMPKPVWAPITMFYAELQPEGHCDPSLIPTEDPLMIDHWHMPLEVDARGVLARVG